MAKKKKPQLSRPDLGGAKFDKARTRAAAVLLVKGVAAQTQIAAVASDALSVRLRRISTGSTSVDAAFGGGTPRGRVIGLYGQQSKGKSVLAAVMSASAQRHCRYCHERIVEGECLCPPATVCLKCAQPPKLVKVEGEDDPQLRCFCGDGTKEPTPTVPCRNCLQPVDGYTSRPDKPDSWTCACEVSPVDPVTERAVPMVVLWWDVERAYTTEDNAPGSQQERLGWLESLGVDSDGVILTQATAETGIDLVKVAICDGLADFIVVDSIAQLAPAKDWETLASESGGGMGSVPRLVNEAFRKWGAAFSDLGLFETRPPTLLTINQVRIDLSVSFGSPEVLPGGKGQLFANSILARVGGKVERHGGKSTRGWGSYRTLEVHVEKNKTGLEGGQGLVQVQLDDVERRLDDPRATVAEAKALDLFESAPGRKWNLVIGRKKIGPFKTQKEVGDALAADPRLYDQVRRHVISLKLSLVAT